MFLLSTDFWTEVILLTDDTSHFIVIFLITETVDNTEQWYMYVEAIMLHFNWSTVLQKYKDMGLVDSMFEISLGHFVLTGDYITTGMYTYNGKWLWHWHHWNGNLPFINHYKITVPLAFLIFKYFIRVLEYTFCVDMFLRRKCTPC